MSTSKHTLVLAIDGGGTRCRVAAQGDVVTVVETGSANASTDFDGTVRQVLQGLEKLADRLSLSTRALAAAPTFIGLAGVTGPEIAGRLRAALPFDTVRIEDDRVAAVRGVLGQRDGVLAHCGTGSFHAAQAGGTIRLSGGWGPVLGDEASAQWVGRQALSLVLECVDGRRAMTPLAQGLLSDLDGAPGIVRFAGRAAPPDFGALAPRVTEHAQRGDALARTILRRGADDIARALRKIGWHTGLPVCLTGGIGPHYADYLPDDLRTCLAAAQGEPLDGAISLARDLARETGHDSA
ncbi:BadF/BadG/BcrA/BcrD ATPase family protein [Tropicibacter sp. S64]|uniref:BadF/BadG/BcrA/BcrD ATPase family protein n=1 Tax=Tropicibacter sp. S64 TaxID=3415122 RepID=UPI003C7B6BD6